MGRKKNLSDIEALYDRGRRVAPVAARLLASAWDERAAVTEAAGEVGEGVAEVRTAYEFARHIDAIAAVVPNARGLILSGVNPHLTPRVVADVVKRYGTGLGERPRERIQAAMGRASTGLHPLAPSPPDGLPAAVAPWHRDLTRLQTAAGLLDSVLTALTSLGSPPAAVAADLANHASAIRVATNALRQVVGRGRDRWLGHVSNPAVGGWTGVVASAKKARSLVDGATGDLLRASHTRPLNAVQADLAAVVDAVTKRAARISGTLPRPEAVPPPTARADPGGPSNAGGTYVILYHAEAAGVVRLGRLDSFLLPAGYLLYVGSAFQGGGVAFRTGRHIGAAGPRLWNADYLRGFARPVERWWTHHPKNELEHAWARVLADIKGFSCPAPGAGANDCKGNGDRRQCPAHLYHVLKRPSCRAFARRLGAAGSGGYGIYYQRLKETTPLTEPNPSPSHVLSVW